MAVSDRTVGRPEGNNPPQEENPGKMASQEEGMAPRLEAAAAGAAEARDWERRSDMVEVVAVAMSAEMGGVEEPVQRVVEAT